MKNFISLIALATVLALCQAKPAKKNSENLVKDFKDLEEDFKKVQNAVINFYWLTTLVKGKKEKVLHHQLDALYDLLKEELDPIMKELKVDAWVIDKQKQIGAKSKWSASVLAKNCRKFEDATIDFGYDLQWLLESLDMVKKEDGILKQLNINEERFRKNVKKLSKVYRGEWKNLFKNIVGRVHKILDMALGYDKKEGAEIE